MGINEFRQSKEVKKVREDSRNRQLQKSIVDQMQNLFADFKTSIGDTVAAEQTQSASPLAQNQAAGTPPVPRGVTYASSTRYQPDDRDNNDRRRQTNETQNMAEMVHDVMEDSKDRLHRIVETLQNTQAPVHAHGMGMKAKPHKYGGEASDGSVDAWISLMRMYLEDCKGAERTRVLTLITFLHKHAQAWIMQKPQSERDTCQKIFNCFPRGSGLEILQ